MMEKVVESSEVTTPPDPPAVFGTNQTCLPMPCVAWIFLNMHYFHNHLSMQGFCYFWNRTSYSGDCP